MIEKKKREKDFKFDQSHFSPIFNNQLPELTKTKEIFSVLTFNLFNKLTEFSRTRNNLFFLPAFFSKQNETF